MSTNVSSAKETKQLIAYFVLAYAISWAIGVPLALAKQGLIAPLLPTWAHYFVAYGPLLSALIVTGASQGSSGLKALGQRIFMWKVRPIWWLAALSPLIIGVVVALILGVATGEPISVADLGTVNFLPPLGLGALALWLLTFGLGEEVGWRGYALPRLQQGRSALSATLILAVVWALWHLPQFFYLFDPAIAIGWVIGLIAGAIVFTWLFNSSGGSLLMVIIWHGCFNFISASDAGNGILAAVVSTIVMVWAVLVIVVFKPANLSRQEKVVA
ncbi:MAG: CPBP family intramembrane metalloprotease [Thermoflexales bacterium]|nr:CPBP family intramembrane metalloprotease [Thermoflexales bacterium]